MKADMKKAILAALDTLRQALLVSDTDEETTPGAAAGVVGSCCGPASEPEEEAEAETVEYDDDVVIKTKTTTVQFSASALSAVISGLVGEIRGGLGAVFGGSQKTGPCICGGQCGTKPRSPEELRELLRKQMEAARKLHEANRKKTEQVHGVTPDALAMKLAIDAWVNAHEKPDGTLDKSELIEAIDGLLNVIPQEQWRAAFATASLIVPQRHRVVLSETFEERVALRPQFVKAPQEQFVKAGGAPQPQKKDVIDASYDDEGEMSGNEPRVSP